MNEAEYPGGATYLHGLRIAMPQLLLLARGSHDFGALGLSNSGACRARGRRVLACARVPRARLRLALLLYLASTTTQHPRHAAPAGARPGALIRAAYLQNADLLIFGFSPEEATL